MEGPMPGADDAPIAADQAKRAQLRNRHAQLAQIDSRFFSK
jgi:hypothetical protein